MPLAFNRALLEASSLGGRPVALASRQTGTGFQIGDLEAAILLDLADAGRDELAHRVAARLEASGRTLQKDGKPVADEASRKQVLTQACETFLTARLPQLLAAGVVEAA